uniref:Secreted peptide n=1 Tax=Rhizophora mucronata TaxID=61149 RepID=A0A2P2QEF4_RHIMU
MHRELVVVLMGLILTVSATVVTQLNGAHIALFFFIYFAPIDIVCSPQYLNLKFLVCCNLIICTYLLCGHCLDGEQLLRKFNVIYLFGLHLL